MTTTFYLVVTCIYYMSLKYSTILKEGFMDILIPKIIIKTTDLGKYGLLAYIFIKANICTNTNIVKFTLDEYFSTYGFTKISTCKTYKESVESLQKLIDLIVDKNVNQTFYRNKINFDVIHSSLKKEIFFYCKDKYLGSKKDEFVKCDFNNIAKIVDYSKYLLDSKITKISYSADLINVYCYILSRMSYRKLKNENGVEHYSNNPIYFYSYKNNILEELNMNLIHFNKIFKMLSNDLNLIREVKFKKHMVKEKGKDAYFMNFPSFYFIENDKLEENLKNAMSKYCKEKGIKRKTLVPNFK